MQNSIQWFFHFNFVPTWLDSSKAIFTTTMLMELPILLSRYTWDTFKKKRGMRENNIFFPRNRRHFYDCRSLDNGIMVFYLLNAKNPDGQDGFR